MYQQGKERKFMNDFPKNPIFVFSKNSIENSLCAQEIKTSYIIGGEEILNVYSDIRNCVIFTNKRIIIVNVQGFTGVKKDYISLPYSKLHTFSVESRGFFDMNSELKLYFSEFGKVKIKFTRETDISEIARILAFYTIK